MGYLPEEHGVLIGAFLALLGIYAADFSGSVGGEPARNMKEHTWVSISISS